MNNANNQNNSERSFHAEQLTIVMKPNRHCRDEFDNRGGVETIILTVLCLTSCACSGEVCTLTISAHELAGLMAALFSLRSFPSLFECCSSMGRFFVSVLISRTYRSMH